MSKKVVFISLPMSGLDDDQVWESIEKAKEAYLAITKSDILDISFVTNLKGEEPPEYLAFDKKCVWYLGRALQTLAKCDEAFFWLGWKNARGCVVEHEVCSMYHIPIISVERNKV